MLRKSNGLSFGLLACAGIAALCAGCEDDHAKAVKSGLATIPWVVDFERTYPGSNHFISHYNIKGGNRMWNSEAFLYDRYTVTMQIHDIKFDASDTRVVSWGAPQFFVIETTKVKFSKGNRSFDTGQGLQFGPSEWKKLEAAKGDISVLGIKVDKHSPVPGFDEIKKLNRG